MRKIALGVAALAVATLTLSGCALAKPSAPTRLTAVKQGTPVTVRGMSVNVTDMYGTNSIGNGFSAEEKHGTWLVLKLHVRNDGTESQNFDATSQTLIDVTNGRTRTDDIGENVLDGRRYSSDMFASSDLGKTSVLLNPGLEDDVVVAYDVPSSTTTSDHRAFVLEVEVGYMRPPAYVVLTGECHSCGGNTQ